MQNIILRKLDIQKRLSILKSLWFLVLLLISFENIGQTSQNFPVDCRVLLAPPYSGKFTDITNSPTKFRVQLLLKDLTKSSIDISLRIRLKGQGVWLENPEGFIASKPITLTPGVPKTFSAVELAEYFAPQNIEAQGIDYAQLLNGLSLPFGFSPPRRGGPPAGRRRGRPARPPCSSARGSRRGGGARHLRACAHGRAPWRVRPGAA